MLPQDIGVGGEKRGAFVSPCCILLHPGGGDDSPQRARGAQRGERRDSRGRATTRVAPTGRGRGRGREDGFLPPQE